MLREVPVKELVLDPTDPTYTTQLQDFVDVNASSSTGINLNLNITTKLTADFVEKLAQGLQSLDIERLMLTSDLLEEDGPQDFTPLFEILPKTHWQQICVAVRLTATALQTLIACLPKMPSLNSLALAETPLTDVMFTHLKTALAQSMENHFNLRHLILNYMEMTISQATTLIQDFPWLELDLKGIPFFINSAHETLEQEVSEQEASEQTVKVDEDFVRFCQALSLGNVRCLGLKIDPDWSQEKLDYFMNTLHYISFPFQLNLVVSSPLGDENIKALINVLCRNPRIIINVEDPFDYLSNEAKQKIESLNECNSAIRYPTLFELVAKKITKLYEGSSLQSLEEKLNFNCLSAWQPATYTQFLNLQKIKLTKRTDDAKEEEMNISDKERFIPS